LKTFDVLWVKSVFERVADNAWFSIHGGFLICFSLLLHEQGRRLAAFGQELWDDLLRVENEAGVEK
jgi:hypothetical protein